MRIDVHNHFYPRAYLERLAEEGSKIGVTVEKDDWGRTMILQGNSRVVTLTEPMYDPQARIRDMDKARMDRQILTLSIPSVDIFPVDTAARLARAANDEFAQICADYPDRFMAFATLSYLDPDKAIEELEYCTTKLGFRGVCIGSNINGRRLDDPLFGPLYQRLSELEIPIHIHPRAPVDKEAYKDFGMAPMLGFEIDLCIAVVRLIMGGVMDKYPNLHFIVSHLGGAIPFLVERVQNCFEAYPECQVHTTKPAREYLKDFYYDTVSFHQPALMCAYDYFGADRMILGSDYPHVIGDIDEAVSTIEALPIAEEEKEKIFSGNLMKLMKSQE